LAFYLRDPNMRTMSVMVMTAAGENPHELGPRVKYPEVIDDIWAVTPDGRNVLFTTYDIEQAQRHHKVWQIAMDGGDPKEIPLRIDRLGYAGRVSFHPDGKRIAFTADSSKSAVWVMENFLPAAQTRKTTASRR